MTTTVVVVVRETAGDLRPASPWPARMPPDRRNDRPMTASALFGSTTEPGLPPEVERLIVR
ncbi:MAG: hypothetical protein M3R09_02660 [Actinomycetota bacterium]|nr:hypothetical protein [Actinomycetota bacterium]